jgi:ribosomal protein S3AE
MTDVMRNNRDYILALMSLCPLPGDNKSTVAGSFTVETKDKSRLIVQNVGVSSRQSLSDHTGESDHIVNSEWYDGIQFNTHLEQTLWGDALENC